VEKEVSGRLSSVQLVNLSRPGDCSMTKAGSGSERRIDRVPARTRCSVVNSRDEEVGTEAPDQSADDGRTGLPAGALEIDVEASSNWSESYSVGFIG
jgi:hypothetical protein